ncbi:MAG: hypothetical protein HY854_25055 [Burkholderiales bacterium]|nr:hypothetical protein [Burkholderiales bacterium]
MKKKKKIPDPDLAVLAREPSDYARNRLLLEWISDDEHREKLFALINENGGSLAFGSRDTWERDCDHCGLFDPRDDPQTGHRQVTLVTDRKRIEEILLDANGEYSNRVYSELGGGSFMLALDSPAGGAHDQQVHAFHACFRNSREVLQELAHLACQAAAIVALRGPDFDMAAFAEQASVRFIQKFMGYSFGDYPRLETGLRYAYRGLVYQVFGRHFTSDPTAIPEAKAAMARLLARTGTLIDAYAVDDEDALKGTRDSAVPPGFEPVMKRLANYTGHPLNGEQLATIALGAAVGSVGNVQSAACIAVKAIFAEPALLKEVDTLARKESSNRASPQYPEWKKIIAQALRNNPPIPFLPRLRLEHGQVAEEILLALGGGTRNSGLPEGVDDPMVWGLAESGKHWCAGQMLAWPLIVEIVRHAMLQPGVAERLDAADDARPFGLTKRWGFACESYPLTHQRDRRVSQSSLNVHMRLKSPVKDNADRVREVIRAGAPRIEEALRGARHVHFAWFELIESDTVLVLHTVYDGPFTAYIEHFALKVGDLFDALFDCIETPPPMPVDKFPNEFVAHIQRFDRKPAMGYFFSAYPGSDVARILRDELARP